MKETLTNFILSIIIGIVMITLIGLLIIFLLSPNTKGFCYKYPIYNVTGVDSKEYICNSCSNDIGEMSCNKCGDNDAYVKAASFYATNKTYELCGFGVPIRK